MMGLRGESMNPMTFGNMTHPTAPAHLRIFPPTSYLIIGSGFEHTAHGNQQFIWPGQNS